MLPRQPPMPFSTSQHAANTPPAIEDDTGDVRGVICFNVELAHSLLHMCNSIWQKKFYLLPDNDKLLIQAWFHIE